MITGKVTGLDRLQGLIDRLRGRGAGAAPSSGPVDLAPLAATIRQILIDGNREGLLAGLDADGAPMAPLAPETIRSRRGGYGPPTVPRFGASGLIDRFNVDVTIGANGNFRIVAGWDGQVPQASYFNSGTSRMPRRKVSGIRPADRAKIQAALDEFRTATGARIAGRF